ncbi:pilus assembly PilX family protein [Exilibacterium tricleocarpae]|nr:PilX N-terminal domain-containing pilus assembly protein [Exilibacterium tricleocarpae]
MSERFVVPHRQQGAVLVVSLVILLVMSVVGVSSMVSTTLQERMAGNARQKTLANSAAETALRNAEAYLVTQITSTPRLARFDGTNGLYADYQFIPEIINRTPATGSFKDNDFNNSENWTNANSVAVADLSAGVTAQNPRYFIEYMGRDKGTANKVVVDPNDPTPTTYPHLFRVVAIGWAQDPNIYSIYQSTFKTGSGKDNFVY